MYDLLHYTFDRTGMFPLNICSVIPLQYVIELLRNKHIAEWPGVLSGHIELDIILKNTPIHNMTDMYVWELIVFRYPQTTGGVTFIKFDSPFVVYVDPFLDSKLSNFVALPFMLDLLQPCKV